MSDDKMAEIQARRAARLRAADNRRPSFGSRRITAADWEPGEALERAVHAAVFNESGHAGSIPPISRREQSALSFLMAMFTSGPFSFRVFTRFDADRRELYCVDIEDSEYTGGYAEAPTLAHAACLAILNVFDEDGGA